MKKVLIFGFFLISLKFFSQTDTEFEKGYISGYYSVMKKIPNIIPVNPNWSTSIYNDTYRNLSESNKIRYEENESLKSLAEGYEKGKRDGERDLREEQSQNKDEQEDKNIVKNKK